PVRVALHKPFRVALASLSVLLSTISCLIGKDGMEMLFKRLRNRAGLKGKRISPHIFRHTFAVRYLMLGGDIFSLQELLGHEDISTIKNYMHLNDVNVQSQKRKFSPGIMCHL